MGVRPPITWFGGKARLAKTLIGHFPPHQTYCEPFGGSGAVLLAKEPSSVEVYNDVNGDLVNLFRVLRDPKLCEALRSACEDTLYSRAEFELSKQASDDPVERARRYLVRHRQSHGGFGGNWSYAVADASGGIASTVNRWRTGVARLPALHRRLRRVQIEQADWRDVLSRYDTPRTLFYVDPPYVPDTRVSGRYPHEMNREDHRELVERLIGAQAAVVLSGYEDPTYSPLEAAGWARRDYGVPAYTSDTRARRVESVWISPAAASQSTPAENMRRGAYQTHRTRVASTETKLAEVIHDMRREGRKITMSAVAAATHMSREHLGRKYRHLFEM